MTRRACAASPTRLGVERFVLDDGRFGGRRHDRAGLGDWWPSPTVYPQGLAPLAEHCRSLGMQFGLWLEPGLTPRRVYDIQAHSLWLAQGLDLKRGGCLDRGEPVTLDAGTLSSVDLRLPALRPGTGCLLVLRGR